jgi:hypothetical protein
VRARLTFYNGITQDIFQTATADVRWRYDILRSKKHHLEASLCLKTLIFDPLDRAPVTIEE